MRIQRPVTLIHARSNLGLRSLRPGVSPEPGKLRPPSRGRTGAG
jgi:hypothetical protein